ncbi:MAG TPA: hypothetical protein VLS88_09885 [Polyangiales bacterium]|nr:hypothetical protein [Polyangiales bacterium]
MATNHMHSPRVHLPFFHPNTEWNSLLNMAPAAVDLVSPGKLAHQGLELLSNAANARRFESVMTGMQALLRDASVPVLIDESRGAPVLVQHDALSRPQRRWLGQVALELYFTQLFRSDTAILDLWPSHFGADGAGDAVWSPRPLYLRWDPTFRAGLQNVYAGFFLEKQERLDQGLRQLGLGRSAEPLLAHLGEGNQRSVRFGRAKLDSTLQAMASVRPPAHETLHRNFIAFGLCLMSLHELLGSLDLAFDVRAAFMRSCAER